MINTFTASYRCSPHAQHDSMRDIPDVETSDWRAVCGRTARTVRREGRAQLFPTPIPARMIAAE